MIECVFYKGFNKYDKEEDRKNRKKQLENKKTSKKYLIAY